MLDYGQRVKLALGDTVRRSALKLIAGLIFVIGAGFLLAALWTWLADTLDWGPTLASLVIGGAFVVLALIVLGISSSRRHEMPDPQDLQKEVEARLALAAEAASARARAEAQKVLGMAESRVHGLLDSAKGRVDRFAAETEDRVTGFVSDTAQKIGLTSETMESARHAAANARSSAGRAANSNAGSMAKLIGAFAVGVTIAARLQEARQRGRDDYS